MDSTGLVAYLNGLFLPLSEARLSPLDRGFLFADGIYEMIPVYEGRAFRLDRHLRRLTNSLHEIRLEFAEQQTHWQTLVERLIVENGNGNLSIYIQITRGAAWPRDHAFPATADPTIFAMAAPLRPLPAETLANGVDAITTQDIRWRACHIKSISLLPNVLARQRAADRGAADAIMVREGRLSEGAASNLFLVQSGIVRTPPSDWRILPGVTREAVIEIAASIGLECREEELTLADLGAADEVWLTSSTREIVPVTRVDGRPVGDASPGRLWRRVKEQYDRLKIEH